MTRKPTLNSLVKEMKTLESETFAIKDYADVNEELLGSTSSGSTSTCSSTTSTTSCSS